MKKILIALAVCSGIAVGGTPLTLSHAITGNVPARTRAAGDTLRILAIMVQFQKDTDPNSTGNGQFDLSTAPQRIIDAPPRDSAYFADHFLFAKNYFRKVSGGRQPIASTVLGGVITLQNKIQSYAPPKRTEANADVVNLPLTNLIAEAWRAADSLNPGFPFHEYDLFVIFHAGPGKDVNLQGNVNYDLTPYDIPSLYFNLPSLRKLLGASYDGVQLKNNFKITNSVILPETENRTIASGTGDYLLQLSINGLIVANIASALGLPDLFDTRTGGTAIGRFGLMDGQAIFSYYGLFPPAPSAWERAYLGWADPVTVSSGTGTLTSGGDAIVKVPISAKEYYLLENRQRDKNKDGQTLTIRWNGTEFRKTYTQDDTHFNSASVDSIYGTVVDVDDFDWSLPGLINDKNNFHGGILIWHIDEAVIEKNLASNTINVDPDRRGVDLEEADGSQDIGQSYGFLDAGSGSEDGSPLDYWFLENVNKDNNPVYKNEFSETTQPSTLTNSLAKSNVAIKNFSASSSVMTFDVAIGVGGPALVKTIKRAGLKMNNSDQPLVADINGDGKEEIVYTSGDAIYALQNTLAPFPGNPTGLFSATGAAHQPALAAGWPSTFAPMVVGISDSVVSFSTCTAAGTGTLVLSVNAGARISTPVHAKHNGSYATAPVVVGTVNGSIAEMAHAPTVTTRVFHTPIRFLATHSSGWFVSTGDSLAVAKGGAKIGWSGKSIIAMASFVTATSELSLAALFNDNTVGVYSPSLVTLRTWTVPARVNASLALYDVNGDGAMDIIIGTDRGVYAYNATGALIENFPLKTLDGGTVSGSPIVLRMASVATPVIFFGSTNGQVYGYKLDGTLITGFPLQTGGIVSSLTSAGNFLIGASTDSSIYCWDVHESLALGNRWNNYLGDAFHGNVGPYSGTGIQRSDELMPKSLAYNWPNPTYENLTHIRYYLGKQATVTVKIFTMAGELVTTLNGRGDAHTDNEIDWDVSQVQSGVYFARIEADAHGETSSTIIKIAVVK